MEIERIKGKVFEERPGFPLQYGPERSDRQPGLPFFPHEVYRDFMTIFLLVGLLFFLTAVATPTLGPSRNPNITPFIVPDWYVLPSWGLLKFSDVLQTGPATYFGCGNVCTIPGPLGPIGLDAAFWGNILTGVPFMFLLTAVVTPTLGPSRNPNITPFTVPDWYVLPSYGLLKFSDVLQTGPATYFGCGNVCTIPGPLGPIGLDAAFWGNILTGVPFFFLLLLPFIDRGREARPAKAPFRSAFGIAFLLVFLFTTSLYAINNLILERWPLIGGDVVLQQFILWPPILAGVASYVGLRRLGYADMYWHRVVPLVASFLIFAAYSVYLAAVYRSTPFLPVAVVYVALLGGLAAVPAFEATWASEREALRATKWFSLAFVGALVVTSAILIRYAPATWDSATRMLAGNMHVLIALPGFSVITAYVGLRRPYSTYEFLLNECYQCGKCHEVCPVTKVEDDALGGLNLVYNTFKKQHDGVPLWTCLACDACSAVCPLDIKYSDYILEERAKVLGMPAPDGGERIHHGR